MKAISLICALCSLSLFAQLSPLADFEPTDVPSTMVDKIWNSMKTGFPNGSHCFSRAYAWSYDIDKKYDIKSSKIFLQYSYQYNKEIDGTWGYHTAPIFKIDGEERIFDRGFSSMIAGPLSEAAWVTKFTEVGNQKLVEKRKKMSEEKQEYLSRMREADRDSGKYRRNQKRLAKLEEEMTKLGINDQQIIEKRPRRIAHLENVINFYRDVLSQERPGSDAYDKAKYNLKKNETTLRKVETDPDYGAFMECKAIEHIEEMDFDPKVTKEKQVDLEWCYVQKSSMYYWDPTQLRMLNYNFQWIKDVYNFKNFDRELGRELGAQNRKTTFVEDDLWKARRTSFEEYKEKWRTEYVLKEAREEAQRNR